MAPITTPASTTAPVHKVKARTFFPRVDGLRQGSGGVTTLGQLTCELDGTSSMKSAMRFLPQ